PAGSARRQAPYRVKPPITLKIDAMAFPPVCQGPGTFTFFVGATFIDLIETPDRDFNGFDDRRPSASTVQHNIAPADLRTALLPSGKSRRAAQVAVFVPAR